MRSFTAPPHRSRRRALAAQLAPAALRTRPYTHPVAEPSVVDDSDDATLEPPRRLRLA